MPHLKSWASSDNISLLPGGRRPRQSTALLAANTRAQSEVGAGPETGQDNRGHALRMLRMQQQIDPAELATQACISLRQLFQLETGATSLFYSDGLRNQAGRRVASILGADWDRLHDAPPPEDPNIRRVQLPGMLMKPASETLVVIAEPTAQLTSPEQTAPSAETRRSRPSRIVTACLLLAVLACGLWAAAETFWDIRL